MGHIAESTIDIEKSDQLPPHEIISKYCGIKEEERKSVLIPESCFFPCTYP